MAGFSYNRLFNTKVVHNFYVDGISKKDLAVFPTESTALAMKNSNLLFRNDEGGFRVLYKAYSTGAPFVNFSNVRLTFAVQLLNVNEFLNFTNLNNGPALYSAGKILYFTNIGHVTTSDLTYSLIDYLRPLTFTYQFPQTATGTPPDLGNLIIKDQAGNVVTPTDPSPTNIAPDSSGRYYYPVDFTKLPKGLYKFETWTTNSATHITETVYIDNELAGQGVFGIVDIIAVSAANSSYPGSAGPPPSADYRLYKMNFTRRATQWKYIVVLKSPSVHPLPTAVNIIDEGDPDPVYGGPLAFSTASGYVDVNGEKAKVITSAASNIPYYETPKKGLTVKINTTETVLDNIQGPPLGVVSAQADNFNITEIFVFI